HVVAIDAMPTRRRGRCRSGSRQWLWVQSTKSADIPAWRGRRSGGRPVWQHTRQRDIAVELAPCLGAPAFEGVSAIEHRLGVDHRESLLCHDDVTVVDIVAAEKVHEGQ